ncbi:SMC-Scp complex subunit ScpB [Coxiella endosymbiont of Amblyomma nuttalli]|uniref:SMC-Scp complex subunit ScpB n=1 Tax=Coxiella endosymbiont of Amblyomma nuttalli TaxID=2749996 RepID=UPI001BA4F348|nr:SMC-Scp complex subunit ScpB [Coxiella endosymbiont of Amblyomma nuttalli]QTS84065.1 Segregation and condensation protein B [Coxiella endosymbiont of Amblyomma nuttalli]
MVEVNRKLILEAALFTSAEPLTISRLQQLFDKCDLPSITEIKNLLSELKGDYQDRSIELQEVASGYRFQTKKIFLRGCNNYGRKNQCIAYNQPISYGEIKEMRGVSVGSDIVKKLLDRGWIKVSGYRDVLGRPRLFCTTKYFLDYFNLKNLTDLPPLKKLQICKKMDN